MSSATAEPVADKVVDLFRFDKDTRMFLQTGRTKPVTEIELVIENGKPKVFNDRGLSFYQIRGTKSYVYCDHL